jgi:Tfp pilus assembly protein PilN
MAEPSRTPERKKFPIEVDLLQLGARQQSSRQAMSISGLTVGLAVLVLVMLYALFPFSVLGMSSLPNLYGYMQEQKDHVADLESDLASSDAILADLRTNHVPHAKALVAQIGETENELADMAEAYQDLFTFPLWSDIIEEIDTLAPDEVDLTWIIQYGTEVIIEGITDADKYISDYAHNLLESGLFRSDPPYDPVTGWTYELTEKSKAELIQTPQMYDNWSGEATLLTSGAAPPGVEYWAVIAAVADYPPESPVSDLQYTDDDAYDVREALLSRPNWDDSHITLLIDEEASKAGIQDAISDMATNGDATDVFFFFFSGHGSTIVDQSPPDEADGWDEVLCAYDFDPLDPTTALTDDELGVWLGDLPGGPILVAIDTCFSGGMVRADVVHDRGVLSAGAPQSGDGFTKDLYGNIDGVVLTACEDAEASFEDPLLQNGVFTYYFVDGLYGPADSNDDGDITMEEAFEYLYWRVTGYTPPYSFSITVTLKPGGGSEQ